jgi:putative ABC transport system permease protein
MRLKLWVLYARRNLRSGLKGFWIFLSCLTLGVSAIAIIGSLAASVQRGLDEQGQPLLGGDVEFALTQRQATAPELNYINSLGELSSVATMRAMATSNGASALVELKAIDQNYPLYGQLKMSPESVAPFSSVNGAFFVAVDSILLSRLNLKTGDSFQLGQTHLIVQSTIETEPDRIADGIIFGPRILMSKAALTATGLVQPGSLVTWRYRIKLKNNATLKAAKDIVKTTNTTFPEAGWRLRTTDKAAQGADEFITRLGYFMTLVSIAALTIGGAGIANAVTAFVNRRRTTIATLKCLGLPNADVVGMFLVEILAVSMLGIAVALLAGALAPKLVHLLFGAILPLPLSTEVAWWPLLFAAVLGLLVTLAFAMLPLSQIAQVQGAALFRNHTAIAPARPAWRYVLASCLLLLLACLIILFSFDGLKITASYLAGLAISFALLAGLATAMVKLAKLIPPPKNILWRQALHSLYRTGATSTSVIMALGLGLTLFVTLALTDQTISQELKSGLPNQAPSFFFLDVKNTELEQFRHTLESQQGVTTITNAPMLRGRISKVKGIEAEKLNAKSDASWALKGDRGLTYSEDLPKGSTLVEGQWWAKDYQGPNLVSMTQDIAQGLGLKIGDTITVNVLGRNVDAEIANLRTVNWKSLGINFVMVFTPATLKAAPHSHIVTVEMKGGDEGQLLNAMAKAYPSVTAVRVKDALTTVSDLLGKMLAAVRGANIITLLTGVLVLAGALAAGLSARSYEAVVLKTYGATRGQLMLAFIIEYGVLGCVAALFGIIVGSIASWFLAHYILEMPWSFSLQLASLTALIAMVLTILAGLSVTARAISAKPSFYLRNE